MVKTALKTLVLLAVPAALRAQTQITLKNAFIEEYKNRATIDVNYTVDKAHAHPNPASKDGDLHIAGRAKEIGLATVAEIMNAISEDSAVTLVHGAEGTPSPIDILGAWRIWCEHGGQTVHVQGRLPDTAFTTTNPPHVFEIHPILRVGGDSIPESWTPIAGYTTKDANDAFTNYESRSSRISVNAQANTTTIVTTMAGYNYVEFKIVLNSPQTAVADGRWVMGQVLTLDDELLVHNRRMWFVAGTPPEQRVKTLQAGDTLHVLGVPRIDLSLVSWRVRNRKTRPAVLTWSLPYEMIIVAVYP